MNNRFTEEFLLNTFSFLARENIPSTSPLSLVCNDWHKVANKDELWKQLIRDEYKEELQKSKLSAKEFYKKNIKARIDTYYVRGNATIMDGPSAPSVDDFLMGFPYVYNENSILSLHSSVESVLKNYVDRGFPVSKYNPLIFTLQVDLSHLDTSSKELELSQGDGRIAYKHIKNIYSVIYNLQVVKDKNGNKLLVKYDEQPMSKNYKKTLENHIENQKIQTDPSLYNSSPHNGFAMFRDEAELRSRIADHFSESSSSYSSFGLSHMSLNRITKKFSQV